MSILWGCEAVWFYYLLWMHSKCWCSVDLFQAVCCSDGVHCCPENTVCDVKTQMCQSTMNSMAISWHMLERLIGAHAGFGSVEKTDEKCPDHKSECPSETTCCQMQSGLYGCCPFKDVSWSVQHTSGKRWPMDRNISFRFSILLQWFALFGCVWVCVCYDSLNGSWNY